MQAAVRELVVCAQLACEAVRAPASSKLSLEFLFLAFFERDIAASGHFCADNTNPHIPPLVVSVFWCVSFFLFFFGPA